jgi:hypothetical protein
MKGTTVNFKPDHTICCTRYQSFFVQLKHKIHYLNDDLHWEKKSSIKSIVILTFSSVSTDCECPRKRSLATKVYVSTQLDKISYKLGLPSEKLRYKLGLPSQKLRAKQVVGFKIFTIICILHVSDFVGKIKVRWAFTTNNIVGVTQTRALVFNCEKMRASHLQT